MSILKRGYEKGVIVLGINHPNGRYLSAPKGNTNIQPNNVLILYGKKSTLADLDERESDLAGEKAHQKGVAAQQQAVARQDREEVADNQGRNRRW